MPDSRPSQPPAVGLSQQIFWIKQSKSGLNYSKKGRFVGFGVLRLPAAIQRNALLTTLVAANPAMAMRLAPTHLGHWLFQAFFNLHFISLAPEGLAILLGISSVRLSSLTCVKFSEPGLPAKIHKISALMLDCNIPSH